ncbi:SRPBCC family protein [Desulfopila inferna]|uniref:SRPBCC family protein n=1 Tax=Desulfopila inferna TaxID=468528 RepID=UPI0019627C7C|nr:SRPBCC family protein [Desulfopila inferna]
MGECYNKIEINSPILDVWNTISNFHDMTWATGVPIIVSKVGDKKGTETGAKRILNGVIHETLINFDANDFTFSYSIDHERGPVSNFVSNYIVAVKLTSIEGGTLVEWRSSFESENDNDIEGFFNPIYSRLLSALKKRLS